MQSTSVVIFKTLINCYYYYYYVVLNNNGRYVLKDKNVNQSPLYITD